MATNYKITAVEQIQYLASAMFSKWKSWTTNNFVAKGKLTKSEVTTALGYTPPTTTYVDEKFEATLSDVDFVIDPDTGLLYYKKIMNS